MRNIFILIICLFFFMSSALAGSEFSGQVSFNKYVYAYTLVPNPDPNHAGKLLLNIKTVIQDDQSDAAYAYTVYHSEAVVKTAGNQIREVAIAGSKQRGATWIIKESEVFRVNFNWTSGQINYTTAGTSAFIPDQLDLIHLDDKSRSFDVNSLTEAAGVQMAMDLFVRVCHKIFSLPVQEQLVTIENSLNVDGLNYSYRIKRDFYEKGEDNLTIRNANGALLYSTKIRTRSEANKVVVHICYARMQESSWEISSEDYIAANFDMAVGTAGYSRIGTLFNDGNKAAVLQSSFPAGSLTEEKALDAALQAFIKKYKNMFIKP